MFDDAMLADLWANDAGLLGFRTCVCRPPNGSSDRSHIGNGEGGYCPCAEFNYRTLILRVRVVVLTHRVPYVSRRIHRERETNRRGTTIFKFNPMRAYVQEHTLTKCIICILLSAVGGQWCVVLFSEFVMAYLRYKRARQEITNRKLE